MNKTFLSRALTIGTLFFSGMATAGTLTLNLTTIDVNSGDLRIAVFNSKATFRTTPAKVMAVASTTDSVTVTFENLPAGDYAVLLFQDTNGNEELDSNLLGIPKEPWGASLNGTKIFGAPKWNDVKFMVPLEGVVITIPMR